MSIGESAEAGFRGGVSREGHGFIGWLLTVFATFHLALIFLLPDAAERFMLGDRSNDRTIKMQNLLSSDGVDGFLTTLFQQASPGDYILFAPAYWLAGPTGVMLQNTVLILLGAWFLWKLAGHFFSRTVANVATTAYLLLPATLFHPHAFVSEAICNPLLIIASYFFLRHVTADRPATGDLIVAGLLAAILCFTRHVYLLLPLFLAGLIFIAARYPIGEKLRAGVLVLLLGYSLVGGWAALAHLGAERYGEGNSVGGMEANLFLRAQRMAAMITCPFAEPIDNRVETQQDGIQTLPPGEFIKFARAHTKPFIKTVVYDLFNITANPGIAMVYGRFFGLFDLGEKHYEDYSKWRNIRDREGIPGLLRELWRTSPLGLILNALGALAWGGFVLAALWGTWKLIRDRAQPLVLKLMVVGLPAYLIGFSSVAAGYTRWDHRSPVEFIVALMFAVGITALMQTYRNRRAG